MIQLQARVLVLRQTLARLDECYFGDMLPAAIRRKFRALPAPLRVVLLAVLTLCSFFIAHSYITPHARSARTPGQNDLGWTRTKLLPYFPCLDPGCDGETVETMNAIQISRLLKCLDYGNCHLNQTKIVVAANHHFPQSQEGSKRSEAIWAGSVLKAMVEMHYTVLFVSTKEHLMHIYPSISPLVRVILYQTNEIINCAREPECIKSATNEGGIPIWQMVAFNAAMTLTHPLGLGWHVAMEESPRNPATMYLGYDVEPYCTKKHIVPHEQRKSQAYVLGRKLLYFQPETFLHNRDAFTEAVTTLGVGFVGSWSTKYMEGSDMVYAPRGIRNLFPLKEEQMEQEIARSKVLVGVGRPLYSPAPFFALCAGVPFINVIKEWDPEKPDDRSAWTTQNDALLDYNPPYVYHVYAHNTSDFLEAIKLADEQPIERFIPENKRHGTILNNVANVIDRNWQLEAEILLNEDKGLLERAKGKNMIFTI